MTNEKAIKELKFIMNDLIMDKLMSASEGTIKIIGNRIDALELAIKALEANTDDLK